MQNSTIEVSNVWKKFRRGELHDSLRDLIPGIAKRIVGRGLKRSELGDHEFWALRDVSFELRRGEALGIIGPNGAGKSTLLKVLSRILRPNRGHYRVFGRVSSLIEVAAGFHQDLTGRENIYLNGTILGMRRREIDDKLEQIVEFSGIGEAVDTPVKRYSSGMLARLGFSVAAHMDPDVLLVDEVLSVGDAAFRAKCVRHMEQLIRSDVSVIFISHNLEQVRQLCTRCIVLDHGQAVFSGDVNRACDEYFACLNNEASEQDDTAGSDGRLLDLACIDEHGKQTIYAKTHEALTIRVTYELPIKMDRIALAIDFYTPDRTYVTVCSTVFDNQGLPSNSGVHEVSLNIFDLPLAEGHYLINPRLLDAAGNRVLDSSDGRYPLEVEGPSVPKSTMSIAHSWTVLS